jgi:glycerol uptake facilitator-like aquaporin
MAGRFRTAFRDSFRVLHVLTLEVFGAFFLALAILGCADTVRQYQMYANTSTGIWRVILTLSFTVLTLGFGLQSFWKVRRIRK